MLCCVAQHPTNPSEHDAQHPTAAGRLLGHRQRAQRQQAPQPAGPQDQGPDGDAVISLPFLCSITRTETPVSARRLPCPAGRAHNLVLGVAIGQSEA